MLFFNVVLGHGGNAIVYSPVLSALPNLRLKTWATYDPVLFVHTVVVIHKSLNASEPCQITIPGGTVGQLITLTAPALTSTSGFTIAGLTFDGTQDGMPLGVYSETLVRAANGVFSFTALLGSATMLKVSLSKNQTMSPLISFKSNNYPAVTFNAGTGSIKPPSASSAYLVISFPWIYVVLILLL